MNLCRSHRIVVLLLVIVMMSVNAWTTGSAGLTHQLEHAFAGAAAADAPHHHHAGQQRPDNGPGEEGNAVNAEHQMLHAADHLQFFTGGGMQVRVALKASDADLVPFIGQPLPLASIDPPFRPPRTAPLPA